MPHYLTIHHEPELSEGDMVSRWSRLAEERRALWVRTWFNVSAGRRFCWWDAPNQEALEQIFTDNGVAWQEIIKVKITHSSEWRWRED